MEYDVKLINKRTILEKNSDINIILLNGNIYRTDDHTSLVLRKFPAFFGSYESAIEYIQNGFYIKKYKIKRELKIILLDETMNNVTLIQNMFQYMINKNKMNNIKIKLEYILIQVLYGIILDKFSNIDLCGMSFDEIHKNLISECKKIEVDAKRKIEESSIETFIDILKMYSTRNDIKPSRVSLRYLDQTLMYLMSETFKSYDGIYYHKKEMNKNMNIKSDDHSDKGNNDLCYIVNKELYEKNTKGYTCVPSEICIWHPQNDLDIVDINKYENGKFVLQNMNHHKNVKRYMKKKHWNNKKL